jgi:TRAP-type C4-dicarboxylate transport system permease small subunit
VALLGGLVALASAQIVLRNVGPGLRNLSPLLSNFPVSVPWGDEVARLAVLWLALLGALVASRDDRHIHMELVARWLPPHLKRLTAVAMDWFTALVAGLLAWYSWAFVSDSYEFADVLLGDVPAWWLQAPMPVAFALISYRYVGHGLRQLRAP